MRPKSMVLILIALGCGLIASIGISQVVERNSDNGEDEIATQPIFVAMVDMSIGDELNAQSVKLEEWPIDKIPEGAITDAVQLEGMSPQQRLFAGEPILEGKLADENALRSKSKTIKKGFRVVSVKVDMASSVSYLITPGDRVDVISAVGAKADTILTNVEVFAVNNRVTREVDSETGGTIQAKTVSLLVTPTQQLTLFSHSNRGRLSLSLRSPDELGEDTDEQIAESPLPSMNSSMPSFAPNFDPLPGGQSGGGGGGGGFIMEVMEGGSDESVRRYTWDGSDELPRELTESGGSAPALADEPIDEFPFPEAPGAPPAETPAGEADTGKAASPGTDAFKFSFPRDN